MLRKEAGIGSSEEEREGPTLLELVAAGTLGCRRLWAELHPEPGLY